MNDLYFVSLLVTAGVCLGFALHAATLAVQTRLAHHGYLFALSLLQAGYCLMAYEYFRRTDPIEALPWGQAFCAFMPFMTWFFGQLTIALTKRGPAWLAPFQRVNLVFTSAFSLALLWQLAFGSALIMQPFLDTDVTSLHRHRFQFTAGGVAYLVWVMVAFGVFAGQLLSRCRRQRELMPMVAGSVVYFVATASDFAICLGVFDGVFTQHFAFFVVICSSWWVLSQRFERSLDKQRVAIQELEDQRRRLLTAPLLLQRQKLDSLGVLAAGVAHEINNPIHAIMNYAQLLRRRLEPRSEPSQFADEIHREGQRVATIVQSLLSFGRSGSSQSVLVEAPEIIDSALQLMGDTLSRENVVLQVEVEDGLPVLSCRASQLQQVVLNFLSNARDAVNGRKPSRKAPKRIRVRVFATRDADGHWLVFEVTDNGDGVPKDIADRIFDPFFTTKAPDKGTGLGLSVSHGIAEAHGGYIHHERAKAGGTIFRLAVPHPASPASCELDEPATPRDVFGSLRAPSVEKLS